MSFQPTVGNAYNVVCPTCFTSLQFGCQSLYTYRIKCESCASIIDLRNISVVEDEGDDADSGERLTTPVQYASEVELVVGCSAGGSAVDQVSTLLRKVEEEEDIPILTTEEANAAAGEEKMISSAKYLWFLHFISKGIEKIVFGQKPYCTIGHVRVFRKRIPCLGYRFIPVPRSSVSYSPLFFSINLFWCCACFSTWYANAAVLWWHIKLLFVLMMIVYLNCLKIIYSDPGFILPAYISGDENAGDQILNREIVFEHKESTNILKSIEQERKTSKWETINGVAMERKWCTQCKFYRPVRAAHCYICGLCCAVHDHHCVVTGGCVGYRNIFFFAFFVTEALCASFEAGLVNFLGIVNFPHMYSPFSYYFVLIFGVISPWLFCVPVVCLTAGLWYNMVAEITTRERMTYVYDAKPNPFNRGFYRNIINNFFHKRHGPSIFREEVMSLWASAQNAAKGANAAV